jgi:CHAT domain-containing protein/Tfp pilus assembly protein PilF
MSRWFVAFVLAVVSSPELTARQASALVIEDVVAGSSGAASGLLAGDRLLGYNDRPLASPAALLALEENTFGEPRVTLRVERGRETLTITAPRGALGVRVRPDLPAGALSIYEEGRRARTAEEFDAAIARWSEAAAAAGSTGAAAWLWGLVGDVHRDAQRWKPAMEGYAAAWELLKQTDDAAARAQVVFALGRCTQALSELPAAEHWYRQAEQASQAAGLEMWTAAAVSGLGDVAVDRGDLARARDAHGRALAIRERLASGSLETAASLHSLARVEWRSRNIPAAQELVGRALALRERLAPESADTAASLSMTGILARERGDFATATEYYTRALAMRERAGPPAIDLVNIVNNLGDVSRMRGDLDAAQEYFLRALAIRQQLGPESIDDATFIGNLGTVARLRGDLAAAEAYQKRALAIRQRLAPGSLEVAYGLNNVGNVARDRGDLAAAEDYHRQSLAIKERLVPGSEDVASSLFNLGGVAETRRDLAAAEDFHRRALAIRERLTPGSVYVAQSLNSLGSISRDRGDLAAADEFLQRALTIREQASPESLNVAETLENLGVLSRIRGELTSARDQLERALGIRERLGPGSLELARDLNLLGRIALDDRRHADALALFSRAVTIVEARRWEVPTSDGRALLLAQNAGAYEGLLRTHLALGDLPAAFAAAERGRARSLLESLSEARSEIRRGVDAVLLDRERGIQRRINQRAFRQRQLLAGRHTREQADRAEQELNALLLQYRELQAEIRAASPHYAALTQPRPLELADVQREVLDEGTLLLEFVLGEDQSHLFVVASTAIDHFALPPRARVERAARRVYDALVARQPLPDETPAQRRARIDKADADYPAAAAALSRLVLQPIAGRLSGQRLLIVADGALQYVPFAALPRPGQPESPTAEPLVVRHEIVNLPSASVVSELRGERAARQQPERVIAVVADPVFDAGDARLKKSAESPAAAALPVDVSRRARAAGLIDDRGSLARLSFSRDEANAIMGLAPKGGATQALDFRASRPTLTHRDVSRARIVHLATHALLDSERPELSGVVLSLYDEQGRPQDGFLRLHEVYNLDWSAELVVLSACQTALGLEIRGEGLIGLTRGFMYGGAERVMASLWSVNDSATAQFMTRFYEELFERRLTPAAALRAAQVAMWRRPSQRPYHWAAFVLQGDWK